MKIEFLYVEEGPQVEEIRVRLQETMARLVPSETYEHISVTSIDEARALGCTEFPTVRIDDVLLSETGGSLENAPSQWLMEAGLLRAIKPRGFLFLCVANSARSQMGEGVARLLAPKGVRIQSAGSHPTSVRPEAAKVLSEFGINTDAHFSKNVSDIDPTTVDVVITLCAEEECPVFLGNAHRIHWGLPDPAAVKGDEEARLNAFRSARDELKKRLSVVFSD